ncbi:MAG: hypothetical protein JST92_02495 [Deltaproteobacteria bacterium]|nr:hypothetical protein [Deltaproteobacteria bacterium]
MSARARLLALALGLAALLLAQGPLLLHDPLLSRDDHTLLDPLTHVRSLADYQAQRAAGRILDLQPVRDLSFWLDLRAGEALGHGVHHAMNLLVWLVCCALVFLLLRGLLSDPRLVLALTLLFALHPLAVGSISWVAARKHLLACAFTLAATLLLARTSRTGRWRDGLSAIACYALGTLAQPIALLWPLWALACLWLAPLPGERSRRSMLVSLAAVPVTLAVGLANWRYYTTTYTAQGVKKLAEGSDAPLGALLSLGRTTFNLLAPLRLAVVYDPRSPLGLAGLLLLPLAVWLLVRALGPRRALTWLGFAAFPLAVVTVRMTNIFVSDTYALLPLAALAVLAGLVAESSPARAGRALPIVSVLVAACAVGSVREARAWMSDAALWAHACETEGAALACAYHASLLARTGHAAEAREVVLAALERDPENPEVAAALGRVLLRDESLPVDERLRLLQAHPSSRAFPAYALGTLLARAGRFPEASQALRRALEQPRELGADLPVIAAEAVRLCELAQQPDCSAPVERLRREPAFDQSRFDARLTALRAPKPVP